MNLLDRYVIRAVLGGVMVVLAVLVTLGALFLFSGQQDDIGQGTYSTLDAFWFVLLNVPQQVYETMPIAVLIGALLGLGTPVARQRAHGHAGGRPRCGASQVQWPSPAWCWCCSR
jgi:lipopolysaccharide export system permease protein